MKGVVTGHQQFMLVMWRWRSNGTENSLMNRAEPSSYQSYLSDLEIFVWVKVCTWVWTPSI